MDRGAGGGGWGRWVFVGFVCTLTGIYIQSSVYTRLDIVCVHPIFHTTDILWNVFTSAILFTRTDALPPPVSAVCEGNLDDDGRDRPGSF